MYCHHAKENRIQLSKYKECNGGRQPLQHAKIATQYIQYIADEVFVIPRQLWWVIKIVSSGEVGTE